MGDPFSEDAECVQVANNSSGDGIYCRTYYTGMAKDCETSGGACYCIEVTGSSVSPHPKPHAKKAHTAVVQLF
ncbi:MAG TPA: hypothetical protein VJ032_08035 [Thermoanaerobaculia bacterium]|nr:hypothetical protein [Thermoanaerobaculia bacterium]